MYCCFKTLILGCVHILKIKRLSELGHVWRLKGIINEITVVRPLTKRYPRPQDDI